MNRYNYLDFNPKMENIIQVINRLGGSPIWSLSHIVPISEYQSVAVFEAWDGFAEEDKEFGRIAVPAVGTTLKNEARLSSLDKPLTENKE